MKTKLLQALLKTFLPLLALLVVSAPASAYYDPGVQRWINRDPIEEQGFNLAAQRPAQHRLRLTHSREPAAYLNLSSIASSPATSPMGDFPISEKDSFNSYCFTRNSPAGQIDFYGLRMRTAFPRNCCQLDDGQRIEDALKDLKKDWKYTQRYPEKGYLESLRGGCNGARRALNLISSCFGPFTPEQLAQFQRIREAVDKYCGGDDPYENE